MRPLVTGQDLGQVVGIEAVLAEQHPFGEPSDALGAGGEEERCRRVGHQQHGGDAVFGEGRGDLLARALDRAEIEGVGDRAGPDPGGVERALEDIEAGLEGDRVRHDDRELPGRLLQVRSGVAGRSPGQLLGHHLPGDLGLLGAVGVDVPRVRGPLPRPLAVHEQVVEGDDALGGEGVAVGLGDRAEVGEGVVLLGGGDGVGLGSGLAAPEELVDHAALAAEEVQGEPAPVELVVLVEVVDEHLGGAEELIGAGDVVVHAAELSDERPDVGKPGVAGGDADGVARDAACRRAAVVATTPGGTGW
jgi:hypothetical protein